MRKAALVLVGLLLAFASYVWIAGKPEKIEIQRGLGARKGRLVRACPTCASRDSVPRGGWKVRF